MAISGAGPLPEPPVELVGAGVAVVPGVPVSPPTAWYGTVTWAWLESIVASPYLAWPTAVLVIESPRSPATTVYVAVQVTVSPGARLVGVAGQVTDDLVVADRERARPG